ncbi:MAG: WYL domain-containing protein [Labilithrix sp.]|nr:WYL domain-containing protein [Labilithrix sp.]MCW5815408.1 WYL domain-containing protein [Labilithrix sp.]
MRPTSTKNGYKPKTPKLGRPVGRFTQHRRLDRLREALEAEPRGLTLEEIATYLRITERSVRRYLRELDGTKVDEKFELLEPVATRPGGPLRWRIKPGERGRAVSLRRAQAYALLATRQGFDVLRGSALYDEVDLALGQIAKIAQTPFRAGRTEISGEHKLESRFVFAPSLARSYTARGEDLDELFRAVADLRVVHYRPRQQRTERQVFRPYAMVMHRGTIYVVGVPHGGEVEALPLEVMTDIRSSETERFELPAGFDVNQYIHGELGVGRIGKARFTVDFDARVADEVKAKRIHPLQRTASSPDGRVRLSLPLVDRAAAVAFVLSWGDAARVVDPPELVADVRAILSRAAARYS